MKKKLFLILLCALTGMAAQAQTTRYVKPSATGSGDGSTWANASGDLQAMINASAAGDEVWVAAGIYKPNAYPSGCSGCSTNRDFTFHLKDGVKLYGGFAGAETLLSQRNIAANPTTLSGDFNNDDVVTGSGSTLSISGNGENAYHVVLSVSDAATTVLDGFTVSGGNADGDIGSNITVETHSIFKSAGGGISNTSSSPTITNITIIGNSATFGGGLDNYTSSSPSITNTTFISNLASFGGAMNTETTSSPTITNTTITGNSATNTGGGMYNRSSSNPDIRNSIIWGNGTTEIVNNSSTPTVSYSIVQGGYAGCSNCPNTNGNANPLLVNAADPAGIDNIHRTADDGIRLQSGSPAINAGANSLIPAGITTDIIGAARIQNTTVDLGAYEGGVCPGTTTLYVDQSISSSSYGTSWDTALKTLDEALRKAHNCPNITTINVAAGTYKPNNKPYNAGIQITTPNARGVTFHLPNGVALYGGFPNGGGTRDIAANLTILSGDIGMAGNASDNAYHVVLSVNDAATTVLDGFTVSEGNANTASSIIVEAQTIVQNRGGGMYNSSSSPRITNTTFTGNSASQGGGMYNFSSSPSITNTTLTGNTGTEGSGMYNRSSSPTITNTTFTGNAAISNGGAMYNYESNPTITNATFTGNAANSNGGALYNFLFSNPTVSNSILWGNGTEITNSSSTPTVTYSIVQGGYAGTGNINADPLFVNAANGNLRLQSCSPAINAGLNSAVPSGITTDLDGNPRFFNSGIVDMGAYEFQGTAAAVTCYQDSDNDGFGNPAVSQVFCGTCGAGFVSDNTDCNDADNAVNPLAPEVCDGIDNNCNNQTDEGNACAVTLSPTMLQLNETGETTGTFTVSLGSVPPNNVTIQLTFNSSQLRVNTGSGLGASPQTVTLTPANALTGVTVTVQAIDDAIAEASPHEVIITTATTASSAPFFNNLAVEDVVVGIADNDVAGVMITQSSGGTAVSEDGATDTYTIRLNSQPTSTVSVAIAFPETDITLNGDTDGIFNTTFTTANWNTPQTITVAAVNDRALEGDHSGDLVHSFSSVDANYNGITAVLDGATNTNTLTVAITDNESAVLAWNPTSGAASEGTTNSTSVRLDITADPLGGTPTLEGTINYSITTTFGTAEATDIGTITGSLSFINATDLASNTITIQHNNDLLVEGPETYTLALGLISAPAGVTLTGPDFIGTIIDADNATVSLSGSATVSEAVGTHNAVVTLSTTNGATLAKELVIPVNLVDNTAIFNGATGDMYFGTSAAPANTTTVTFPAGSGNGATQNVPINIHDDRTVERSTSSSAGFNTPENFNVTFGTLPAIVTATNNTITVTIDENDFAYITMDPTFVVNDQVDIESNTSRTSNVRVRIIANGSGPEQVQDAFSVPVQSSDLALINSATGGADYIVVSTTVTFPAGSMNNSLQPVPVTIINDDTYEFYGALSAFNRKREFFDVGFNAPAARAAYAGVPILVPVSANDNCDGTNGRPNLPGACRDRQTMVILDDDCPTFTITPPTVTQPTCAAPTGTIVVNATGSGTLDYSVNNGSSWQSSATFSGLAPGNYDIKVRLQADPGCEAAYGSNPVMLNSPFSATITDTWTGCVSTDWATPGNWQDGTVPTAADNVTIPNVANDPVIMGSTAAVAKSVLVQAGAVLTINTLGSLTINGATGIGLLNQGTTENAGTITIGDLSAVAADGIQTAGVFNNNLGGSISINRTGGFGGINNSGTFTNAGGITIGDVAISSQDNIENYGTFINTATGVISVDRASNGIWNIVGTFQNDGKINIGSIAATGTGILSTAPFTSSAGAEIHIDRVPNGIANTNAFTNAGLIRMGENAPLTGSGIANVQGANAVFNNNAGGDISIKQTAVDGVLNEANSTFNNNACATLSIFDNLNNSGIFTNAGLFTVNTTQTHTNSALTNNGIISYPQGNPIPNVTNNEIIVALTTANDCDAISPAFGLGSPVNFTIIGIFTDAAATMSAGTYVTATNTFTPTATLAEDTYSLFVKIQDGSGGCTRIVPWTLTTENCCDAPQALCKTATIVLAGNSASLAVADVNNGSTADCGQQSISVSPNTFNCSHVGTPQTVTLTITDVKGVSASCQTTVTVQDNTPPTITCPATQTLTLGANCTASLPDYTGMAAVSDSCGVQSVTQSPEASMTVSGAGNMTVTLTVTDVNGLTNTCDFTVNKVDDTPPSLTCRTATIYLDPTGNYSLLDTDVLDFDASTDNCSAITVTGISPSSFDCGGLMQTFDVLVIAQDDSGNSSDCIASITVFEGTALPQPWVRADVGNPDAGNTYQYSPCSQPPVYTVQAGAANNSQTADNLAAIAQTLCGDFSIEVKIEAVTPNGWAGLTARESTAPGSKMVGMYSNLGSVLRWESRLMNNAPKSINLFQRPFPYWLRLVRQGNLFIGYYSINGSSYSIANIQTIPMGSCLEVGVAAFTTMPGQTATAVFSNLTASGGAAPSSIAPGYAVEPAQGERAARLWPNPARGAFTLELPAAATETRLRLLNQLGQPLEERRVLPGESQLEWQIGHLSAGVYFVEVLADSPAEDGGRTVLRLVKTD
jgi:hypothetical protein